MGSWGWDSFENDDACDWVHEFERTRTLKLVESVFKSVLKAKRGGVDAYTSATAIAACEVVARLKGNFGARDSYTESVDAWVEAHPQLPSSDLVNRALLVLDRVIAPESELRQLANEALDGGGAAPWLACIEALRRRLIDPPSRTAVNTQSGTAHCTPPGASGLASGGLAKGVRLKVVGAVFVILCVLHNVFPRFGPPQFRYTGSDPERSVWNFGWPLANAIHDPQSGFHMGPGGLLLPLIEVVVFSAVVVVWVMVARRRHANEQGPR